MILPHPESDLSLNILVLGSEIIEFLKSKKGFIVIENIMEEFLKRDKRRGPDVFLDTLTFLFTVGLIEYKGYKVRLRKNDFTQATLF